ncbi:hypothetical protein N7510_005430 [Penicillium lagena]|uniref:uncharacterized protein n=1 Tax=Penicillium lagena TaxID=94218 RepID=UPI00254058B7|nr:uncharacterized protein N7510_005430 [Penicillium lagena]KAJ5612236.1 hypothetical protein N7510_005430 [Penicillium lagena]
MDYIKIPSPSTILDSPKTLSASVRKPVSRSTVAPATIQRPKQTKSRNGCSTCKAKRLKCDESKPSCQQCERRKVPCGGYKKDFKWRPFEETNLAPVSAKSKKASAPLTAASTTTAPSVLTKSAPSLKKNIPTPPTPDQSASPVRAHANIWNASPPESPLQNSPISIKSFLSTESNSLDEFPDNSSSTRAGVVPNVTLPAESHPANFLSFLEPFHQSLSGYGALGQVPFGPTEFPDELPDLTFSELLEDENEDIEDIIRQSDPDVGPWNFSLSEQGTLPFDLLGIPTGPSLSPSSQEMMILRYDKLTCGILSVKDGITENPWRTLVWPLAKDTPALYHAIFALTAFHSSKENPSLRVQGVAHMRQSITSLMQQIQDMRADAALATSLALAFADTWDQHTRTCIQHLRGAKALVSRVLNEGLRSNARGDELDRVRFLYNTWSYMDVIARLTSMDDCGTPDFDLSIFHLPSDAVHEIDPLMGCAATLYPLMSRVAELIQRVRKSSSNTVSLVAQAMELKSLLEQWEPPRWFEPPEDPTSEVQHSVQLAHAYRWATLLYLHQAVPEMPSEPTDELAKRVLILLATVPYTSRTTIIQMFPLLAAGSEVDMEDDRNWVLDRWTTIQSRLMLGGVDRCLEVLQEVWKRRDATKAEKHQQQQQQQQNAGKDNRAGSFSNADRNHGKEASRGFDNGPRRFGGLYNNPTTPRKRPVEARFLTPSARAETSRRGTAIAPLVNIEFERTVRGRLHWVNIMAEWGWEVFVG